MTRNEKIWLANACTHLANDSEQIEETLSIADEDFVELNTENKVKEALLRIADNLIEEVQL